MHEQLQNRISIQQITHECAVCAMDKPQHEFQGNYSDECLHVGQTVCDSCIYENTKYLIKNTSIFDEQVTCPEYNCNGTFNFDTIRHILLSTGENHIVFEQYDEHLIHRRLEQMTEFVWCAHECGSGQLHDLEGSSTQEVTCIKCRQRTCFTLRTVWHTGLSCADYDLFRSDVPDDASHTWLEGNTTRCPQCRWHIEKNAGCSQMKCRRCH
jgi:E3 ubiquitin-protein ligase RNF144